MSKIYAVRIYSYSHWGDVSIPRERIHGIYTSLSKAKEVLLEQANKRGMSVADDGMATEYDGVSIEECGEL